MVFNSYIFVFVFLPAVIIIYHLLNKTGHYLPGRLFLLAASLLFYLCSDVSSAPVLIASILINYCIHLALTGKESRIPVRRLLLVSGLILNIGCLIVFKYLGFFAGIISSFTGRGIAVWDLMLPLGISYYTFSQIMVLSDSYRDPTVKYSFIDYALFVTFFPKILMGPIAKASQMIPQFNDELRKKADPEKIAGGMVIFAVGLSKKVLLADNLAPYVTWGYSNIDTLGSTNALLVMLAYTLQIYFDFSGFCDMASAICLMLGLSLPDNFLSPYRACSVAEFWKRWHITLTGFFTEYVYIPLGGNRKGSVRTYVNMFIIFFLSGLWHGAAFTFIIWGLIHGIGISVCRMLRGTKRKLPKPVAHLLTFIFVNIAWIFFRSQTLEEAFGFLKQLFSFKFTPVSMELLAAATPSELQFLQWFLLNVSNRPPYINGLVIVLGFLILCTVISMCCKNATERLAALKLNSRAVLTTVILMVLSILSLSGVTEYIYTNF
ncbi:MAG: MBOAT family protein [Lachnospiraceae bacterium]|nr:MBOAT family protein [Lachnospiraceae bacterium]